MLKNIRYNFRQSMMDHQAEQVNIYEQDIEILKEQVRSAITIFLLCLLSVCIIK